MQHNNGWRRWAAALGLVFISVSGACKLVSPGPVNPGVVSLAGPDVRIKTWEWRSNIPTDFTSRQAVLVRADSAAPADDFSLYVRPIGAQPVEIRNNLTILNETQFSGGDARLWGYRPIARSRRSHHVAPATEFFMRSTATDGNADIIFVLHGQVGVYPANDPENDTKRVDVTAGQYVTVTGTPAAPVISAPQLLSSALAGTVDGVDVAAVLAQLQADTVGL